ncbi:histidine phosphatase family protein [Roseateles sp. BYS87W]|uniref:Histidine phosphatase family protein n=1 Tax=Pelomonas baiyunensis TaxID=3299026 RepID=A0ABW7GY30_9BURK
MLTIWRHPRPIGATGRCIGARTDLPVDPRKAKRLAHRIRAHARRQGLPRDVVTSPLRRAADVGRWLQRWGFRWRVDAALREMDFGDWDGCRWEQIPPTAFDAWMTDFNGFGFGPGECLRELMARAATWQPPCALAVGHAGWITARLWAAQQKGQVPTAATWPVPLGYAQATSTPFAS